MAPLKSPCDWFFRPWFVLLWKPNVRTSPQRHSPWLQSQSATIILIHVITSKCPEQHLQSWRSFGLSFFRGNWYLGIIMCYPTISHERSSKTIVESKAVTAVCSCIHSDSTISTLRRNPDVLLSRVLSLLVCHTKCTGCSWDLLFVLCTPITDSLGRKVGF